jgi:hypothetical protein
MKYFGNNSILKSIEEEIKSYNQQEGRIASFIIIHEADTEQLRKEMVKAKMIPDNGEIAYQIRGLHLIRTNDIRQGMFAISGE